MNHVTIEYRVPFVIGCIQCGYIKLDGQIIIDPIFGSTIYLTSKKSIRKILILSGTHDIQDIYFFFKNDLKFRSNTSYYIKAHPKNKFHFESEKNLKKVENLKYQIFNEVIISSTSTLMYDFKNLKKNFRIFCPDYKFM